jgi:PKD repeat protein
VAITVTCVNDAPVAVDDSYVGVEDTVLSVPAMGVLANDVDVDGDVLTATLLTDVVTGTLALSSDGALVYTPTLNWFGVVTFTYQANDGLASSETAVVTLTILSENDPPLVDAGSDQNVNEGDVVQFNGTFVDPGQQFAEGGTGIQWDFGDGYTASGTLTPTHSYGDNGVYTVTLTITDTGGAAMSDNLLVTAANIAPELSALPDQSVLVGTVVSFTAVFTDPGILDTHTAVINWGDGSSEAGTVDPSAMTVSGSHLYASEGVYTVTVTLTDDDGGTATQTFTVTATDTVPTGYTLYLPFVTQ